jgi:hypothetical protein
MMLSPGQLRLQELVTDVAADIDLEAGWEDPPTLPVLTALRVRVLADTRVTKDDRTGQDLRVPSVPATYVQLQEMLFPMSRVSEVTVTARHLLFAHIDIDDPPIAAAGGNKWVTTYGALTHFARRRKVYIGAESPPTVLSGSSVIAVGAGSNHRTLASFLWGEASLKHDPGIRVIQDVLDRSLWRACERLEAPSPPDIRRFGILLDLNADGAQNRRRVMALSKRAEHEERFAGALDARWSNRPHQRGIGSPSLQELEHLGSTALQLPRRRWFKAPSR